VFVKPNILQAADGGCRQPGSILAEQRRQSLGEVAGGDTLQVKDRQQRLDRFRAAHVGRQYRRREPDAVGVGSVRLAIAHTRLADGDRTDTGHHLAFRQVTVAYDPLVAVRGLQIGMLAKKVRDLGLDRLGQQSTRPVAQDFGELILDVCWLDRLDDVIFGRGISLLRWRSGGVKHPHDMPPSRFSPSPTFSDSSANSQNEDVDSRLNGEPSVAIGLYLAPGANAIQVADLVNARMDKLRGRFPAGLQARVVFDSTVFVKEAISAVIKALIEALVLVTAVVFIFLGSWRPPSCPLLPFRCRWSARSPSC